MNTHRTLVISDIVDSTRLHESLGDAAMAELWTLHDTTARGLIRKWRGTELGRSDGFFAMFEETSAALGFALDYHAALSGMPQPIKARVGMHTGPVSLRENSSDAIAHGAVHFEVDGIALPIAARVSALAGAGQTLVTDAIRQALEPIARRVESHGFWRLKGLAAPLELFEIGDSDAPFAPPPDSAKAYRVVRHRDGWITLKDVPNNLPAGRDAFVGRSEQLGSLAQLLDNGDRLVTVLGIGGIGKTRLTLQYARGWLGDFPGGAWFCDLNATRTRSDVLFAVAKCLELELHQSDPIRQLGTAIAHRGACLLILDNFEQVARHAEATVGAWLEHAPDARFIVTSREVLGVAGERVFVVPPLNLDEAGELFRERVKSTGSVGWRPDEDNAVLPLMDLLDRLPLAIELAAARSRVMGPDALLRRMSERFKLLAVRSGRQDRQATLRATLDWSWDLLSPAERAVIEELSVFEGGSTIEAASAVVDTTAIGDSIWMPDLLQTLVEKSLLRCVASQRFDLLRTVHDYATERLAARGAASNVERRHWEFFSALDDATAGRGIELDNLIAACRRAAASDCIAAVALLGKVWAVLKLTGPFVTAVELGDLVGSTLPPGDPNRAVVDRIVGAALSLLGEVAGARNRYESARQLAARTGDQVTHAEALCLLAELELGRGHADAATALLEEARKSPVMHREASVQFLCLNASGKVCLQQSRWNAARSFFEQALTLAEALGNRRWQGGLQGNLGTIARAEGRRDDARRHWQAGLALADEVGDRQWAGNTRCNLGLLLHELGNTDDAERELKAALEVARAIGHRRLEATALCNLGLVAEARGDFVAARDQHAQAADVAQALGSHRLEGQARGYLGLVLASLSEHQRSSEELRRARELLQPQGDPSAIALVLLQSALAAAARGDIDESGRRLDDAKAWVRKMAEHVDPEIAAMLARAEQTLATSGGDTPGLRQP